MKREDIPQDVRDEMAKFSPEEIAKRLVNVQPMDGVKFDIDALAEEFAALQVAKGENHPCIMGVPRAAFEKPDETK